MRYQVFAGSMLAADIALFAYSFLVGSYTLFGCAVAGLAVSLLVGARGNL